MRIGIDLTSILYHRGVSRYTSNLYRALSQFETVRLYPYISCGPRATSLLQQELRRLEQTLSSERAHELQKHLCHQSIPPSINHWLWHYLHLNGLSKKMPDINVFHSWDYLQPPDRQLAVVSTIHDLAILKYRQTAHWRILQHHRESWRILKKRQAHIIAVSESTRQDIINLLEFAPERVHRVYEALPQESFFPPQALKTRDWKQLKTKFKLEGPYFLFVGTREPRKNLPHLLDAWRALRRNAQLVIVGAKGWENTVADDPGLHFLEHVTDQELAHLYTHAVALAYPSLDEGFGLPILEGFAYQTPVITSNRGAMQEIAGQAAFLVDPLEVDSLREGLEKALNLTPSERQDLSNQMKHQLAKFSWEKTARDTLNVYQQAIKEFYA
ncbi:glycosyltransferase family 4 protein [bacterium]|nr:glycosyltransferase family 4 protein [bacterium]